ncbi:hypothetical protein C8Q72DRAFT_444310 [Fomitopsis betulina]|nr:hypothetical protein C8Q72DRAFT_444310 [Fomitopsis betulina]
MTSHDTTSVLAGALIDLHIDTSEWYKAISVNLHSGDLAKPESWVFFDDENSTRIGRIHVILQPCEPTATTSDTVIIEAFKLANSRHPYFGMPEVFKLPSIESFSAVSPKSLICLVNVQHNCIDAKCGPTGRKKRKQERTLTDIEEPFLEHNGDERHIINTHALHNAALLRKILPRHLTEPIPYIDPDKREQEHHKMAAALRGAQDERRAKEAAARIERKTQGGRRQGRPASDPRDSSEHPYCERGTPTHSPQGNEPGTNGH